MLMAIHAKEDRDSAQAKGNLTEEKLMSLRLSTSPKMVRMNAEETLNYISFLREDWMRLRSNNMLERIMKET